VVLKLNGTFQILVYADVVNLLGGNTNTIKKSTKALIDTTKEVGLEVITEKTMYMQMSRNQTAGKNNNIMIANGAFENVAKLKYL
jgi:hypothetical protein